MRLTRVFVEQPLSAGAELELGEQAAAHAVRVVRLKPNDNLTLFDGRGGQHAGTILEIRRGRVRVRVGGHDATDRETPLAITLAQGVSRGDRMDWVIQKATELGVRAIVPVLTERSVVKLDGDRARKRNVHWQEVAISACEQCGRNVVPTVLPLLDLNQYLAYARKEDELRFLLSPEGGHRLREMDKPYGRFSLLVGPEGGFEEGEVDVARSVGFTPLQLGPRVLRTETAGLAALAAMMALWGDL